MSGSDLTPVMSASQLLQSATSPEVASIVNNVLISLRLHEQGERALQATRDEYVALFVGQDKDMSTRDRDRIAVQYVTDKLIDAGRIEEATAIFGKYLEGGPSFSRDVVALILGSKQT